MRQLCYGEIVGRSTLATITILLFAAVPARVSSVQVDFDSVFDKANQNYRQGKYDEALSLYKKANAMKDNKSLECLWGMAQTFNKLGANKNTLQTCDRLIQIGGDDIGFLVKAWNMRGNSLSAAAMENPRKPDETKLREAEAAFREVLKFSSELSVARYSLGVTLIRLNRLDEGLAELQAYIKNPDEEDTAERARKIIANPRRVIENFAPDFSILTSGGEYISSDELSGKVILLDFWGIWCKPCLSAIPYLSQVAKKYKKEAFVLISVDVNDEEATWREYIAQNKMSWTHTRDSNSKIQRAFQVTAFPSYFLIDHEGIIRYRGRGSGLQTESEISNAVNKTLKILAASANQPRPASTGSKSLVLKEIVTAPQHDLAKAAPAPSDAMTTIASPKADVKRTYLLRIPKPVIEVTAANLPNAPAPLQDRSSAYTLRLRNWASMPDELFSSSKNLIACSVTSPMSINSTSTRLEVIVLSEQGQMLRSFCDPPRPEILQNLPLIIPNQVGPGRIYVTLKDRLTGNSVQSDLVALPY